ncbi:oxalate decarboxylase [Pedobacter cryoconitis]|uniref:Oxalate decarboxylase n=1 Tax=Pedobacter cryoconitis TaxID=188932 RepID=A0A7W9DJP6_9SPHI|nr:cupin domain-containing protein [Pedobacter cryoconitis]MBB5620335.1 oxalate decarboxylase [Pedobacter cryoconitis]MBB5647145.1 oxalate decarboxylase [Pedobacter cryoconitis]
MATTRRGFISAASLSTFGLVTAATSLNLLIPQKADAAVKSPVKKGPEGPQAELEDFVYDIENGSTGWTGTGGTAKEATVEEFPVSQSIAAVIMRLNPGSFRELHWHSIAAEWAYILEGKVRTTVVSPDGTTSTDDFEKGDIWYFPKGHGHCLQCLGDEHCLFLLGFDNGHFSEFGTFSSTDWISHISPEIMARNSGLSASTFAAFPHKELYIGTGKIATAPRPQNLDPNIPTSSSAHKFRMEKDGVFQQFAGGFTRKVSSKEFPIQTTLTALRMDIEPGAIRELHWHPNADEWQYVMSGKGNLSIFGSHGRVKTMPYKKGMVSFIKQGYGHYIENTGTETLKLIILFNAPEYQEISLNDWLSANPAQLVQDHFGITPAQTATLAHHKKGIF